MKQASPKISRAAEPETIRRARCGDSEAFAALYNDHHAQVFRYIRSRVQDHHLAEDLASDTFLRALRRIDTFTWQGRDLGAWLVTIARNLVTDHYKASRTRREVSVADMRDADRECPSAEEQVLPTLVTADQRRAIVPALASLTVSQRTVLRHRYLEDRSIQETAASMALSTGAVKTATCRATRGLQHRLAHLRGAA